MTRYITDKFSLYRGLRTKEKDDEILERVSGLCFLKAISFLSSKLDKDDKDAILAKVEADAANPLSEKFWETYLSESDRGLLEKQLVLIVDEIFAAEGGRNV